MVQNDDKSGSDTEMPLTPPAVEFQNLAKGIDEGSYKLIGWAADTTGRRLIDEICQIAAYTPDSQFSQYIMPFGDIRLLYRRRHNIRIMSVGKYRMLKDLRTNKFVNTKSEVTTLAKFIEWLEENRGEATDGIILVYHEVHKTIPAMLLESMRRHGLDERFAKVVKGFANSYGLSASKCANTTKTFTLRVMSKVLLNKENNLSSAVARAQASYNVAMHLGQSERNDLDAKGSGDAKINNELLINMIRPFTNPISAEEDEIKQFKVLLDRQNTFKPVFGALMKGTPPERQHASHLRRMLAENCVDFEICKSAYEKSTRDGLNNILITQVQNLKDEEKEELLEILDCYFDPEKKAVQPKPKFFQNHKNRRYRTKSGSKDKNANRIEAEGDEKHDKSEKVDKKIKIKVEDEESCPMPEGVSVPKATITA
ncbi:maternal protein exuperantia isoform X2 [Atheta coriaria]|uniref:maternal protein exuperantia isoform X2 n=1 Tax=Dalotia coriaria TaxID=877792 RepID=UPI0031F3BB89